jgi:signal peptidase II
MGTQQPRSVPRAAFLRWLMLFSLTLAGCGFDQATKAWAREALPGNPMSVLPQVLEFRYAENPAIAFSIFQDLPAGVRTPLIFAMSGIGLLVLMLLIWKSRHQAVFRLLPLALILAGAAGNLMDRFALGFVVDFVRVHWRNSWSFPIFNVADALISVGMVLFIAGSLIWPLGDRPLASPGAEGQGPASPA